MKRLFILLLAGLLWLPAPTRAQDAEALGALVGVLKDVDDPNLPLMYWYATEPVVAADPKTGVQLLAACKLPKVRQFITRRMATGREASDTELSPRR